MVLLVALLTVDLGVFHRRTHSIALREAIGWSLWWVALGCGFGVAVFFYRGETPCAEYFTAYIVEKSLSVDNLFVIAVIFKYFRVEPRLQHRVLFWGIVGAIILRGVVILAGISLLKQFWWTQYLFGTFLIYSGTKMLGQRENESDFSPERNIFVRMARRLFTVTDRYDGGHFFVRPPTGGASTEARVRWSIVATPLLVVLIVVETADLVFAVDSIPAVLAITRDVFIVVTSNIFAVLGLRAMYFVLAGVIDRFHHLKLAVCVILVFVGTKMVIADTTFGISTPVSLAVILSILITAVVFSIWRERRRSREVPALVSECEAPEAPGPEVSEEFLTDP